MRLDRIIAYLLGLAALGAALLVYGEYIYLLGFPDGFITDLERAERNLAYIFIGVGLLASAGCVYLGWAAGRKKIYAKLALVVALYLIICICLAVIDGSLRASHLPMTY